MAASADFIGLLPVIAPIGTFEKKSAVNKDIFLRIAWGAVVGGLIAYNLTEEYREDFFQGQDLLVNLAGTGLSVFVIWF